MTEKTPAQYWLGEIQAYDSRQQRAHWELWSRHAVGAYSLTQGEQRQVETIEGDNQRKRYNVFWSNVENLKPGMYARTPNVVVSRRHTGSKNPVAKTAANVLENVIAYQLDEHGFGSAVRAARDDYLLVGRGVAWARYVPHEVEVPSSDVEPGGVGMEGAPGEGSENPAPSTMLDFEEIILDYVHWTDFGHTDARRWEDVRAVWRRIRMTKEAITERWGDEWAQKLNYDANTIRSGSDNVDKSQPDGIGTDGSGLATIYEVWDAHKRQILFVAPGQKQAIETIDDDPLKLPRFFPCSRPVYATLANDDLFPVSDYRQYRTQIKQIQQLTQRIDGLTEAVKIVGVYDSNEKSLEQIFQKPDGTLIPVTNWAALAAKGGLDGSISFVPIKEIAETLQILHEERDKALADSYQLTGISDLIRGDTQASETATAQGIKDKYISMRFDEKRREIARFVVNTLNNYGAIVCHVFSDKSIVQMSGLQLFQTKAEKQACEQAIQAASAPQQPPQPGMPPMPPPAQMPPDEYVEMCEKPTWEEVLAFLRNDAMRSVNIDIESDSTVASDQAANQQAATQFLEMLGQFLEQSQQVAQGNPMMVPLLGHMLSWGVRQFPIGRDLEEAVDATVAKLEKAAQQAEQNPQQAPPDPKMIEVQGRLKLLEEKQQGDQALADKKLQGEQAIEAAKAAHGAVLAHGDQAHEQGMDMAGLHADAAHAGADRQQDGMMAMLKAHFDAQIAKQAEESKAQTAILIAHIQNLGKVEVAGIAADANVAAAQEAQKHETDAGA